MPPLQDRYASLYDALEGTLERPAVGSLWPLPDLVKSDRKFLYWEAQYFRRGKQDCYFSQERSLRRGMLTGFLQLENADKERILRYARRWGLLHTRRAHRLVRHEGSEISFSGKTWLTMFNELSDEHNDIEANCRKADQNGRFSGREPLYIWRYWAKKFNAALRVRECLEGNTKPQLSDWEIMTGIVKPRGPLLITLNDMYDNGLGGHEELTGFMAKKKFALQRAWLKNDFYEASKIWHEVWDLKVKEGKALLIREGYPNLYIHLDPAENHGIFWDWYCWSLSHPDTTLSTELLWLNSLHYISKWQCWAGVGIGLDTLTRKLQIQTNTLFAGLVWQLMAAFGRCAGLAICAECGCTYRPKRNYRFCRKCGAKASGRQRQRRLRVRKKTSTTEEPIVGSGQPAERV